MNPTRIQDCSPPTFSVESASSVICSFIKDKYVLLTEFKAVVACWLRKSVKRRSNEKSINSLHPIDQESHEYFPRCDASTLEPLQWCIGWVFLIVAKEPILVCSSVALANHVFDVGYLLKLCKQEIHEYDVEIHHIPIRKIKSSCESLPTNWGIKDSICLVSEWTDSTRYTKWFTRTSINLYKTQSTEVIGVNG